MTADPSPRVDRLRLLGALGTNKVMAGELSRLSRRALSTLRLPNPTKHGQGAVSYPFIPELAAIAATYHRTSARVLWDVCESTAGRLEPLAHDVEEQVAGDQRDWLWSGCGISVQAFRVDDFAAGERQVVGTVKNAVIAGAARRGIAVKLEPQNPDVLLNVRLREGVLRVSVDLGGGPMNHRGYRQAGGEAPLREDAAANLLMLSRWDARTEALVDPMSGSGTITIEAACMAQGRPLRAQGLPLAHKLPALASFFQQTPRALFGDTVPTVIAGEIDAETSRLAEENLARAQVTDLVECRQGDFRDLDPAELLARAPRGVVVSNPPYGERLGDAAELEPLYEDLGRWCRELRGWRAAFLVANPAFEACFGGKPRVKKPMKNGPLDARFLLYDL